MNISCYHTGCPGFEMDLDQATATAEDIGRLMEAQSAHMASHVVRPDVTHIRKQMGHKRGNGFYKVQYGPAENGSQTLCGAPATTEDTSYGDARHAKNLAYVNCGTCIEIRKA
jgi:hypothetical protein